jgi:hypothetical protein
MGSWARVAEARAVRRTEKRNDCFIVLGICNEIMGGAGTGVCIKTVEWGKRTSGEGNIFGLDWKGLIRIGGKPLSRLSEP